MAHQSGIRVSSALESQFRSVSTDGIRVLQAHISGESVEPGATQSQHSTLLDDFDSIPKLLNDTTPCYLLIRLDTDKWAFATYVPDGANVRSKMLYAATKATVTRTLGESHFIDTMFGTTQDDFSSAGYKRHRVHAESSAPLTEREQELERIRDDESKVAEAPTMDSRRSHARAVYPLHEDAKRAIREFASGTVNFVLLTIDSQKETVNVEYAGSVQLHYEMKQRVPQNVPSYALYWFDGSTRMFVYSCPSSSSVRERMVYSTFRHGFTECVRDLGVEFDIRMEVDDPEELSAEALESEVSSRLVKPVVAQPKFKRPVPPNRRPRTTPS
ncbi:Twinfilin-1 [Coemansia sp. RSA 353]|nr:Twinfilin-1 [Coemansia sp. RSA 788]KAJ2201262.1 Twinfilin-1 [Coemansia sp. RSA 522]KAJ2278982.1 Twinfilin-1 [Coemansia sp. RSA 371]KAJ2284482.1 Twinfilin-1 [Coemansia sp. RSA 370]KAJ2294658.1 Twinfilin-1 [Coemansia sp. RSA 355]KAJ2301556.1 Twinfilin-1 [Coemansia sp. RSA 353]